MNKTINTKEVETLVAGIDIPAQPAVLRAVTQEQRSKAPNLNRVAEVISTDVALSAGVLKAINSPLYGLRNRISSIQQAVMLLGFRSVVNLVTGLSLRQAVKGNKIASIDHLWESAADVSLLSMALSRRLRVGSPDDAYLLGLFHDCGIPLLMLKHPEYEERITQASGTQRPLSEIEEQYFNTNHSILGYYVARSWGVSPLIAQSILRHHDPNMLESKDQEQNGLLALLTLANHISHKRRYLSHDLEWDRQRSSVLKFLILDENEYGELVADLEDLLDA